MTTPAVTRTAQTFEAPAPLYALFNDKRAAILWLLARLWLGWQWIEAASHKITNPAWMQTGEALKGFWSNAVKIPETGRPPISFDWYRTFIQFMLDSQAYTWFAKFVAVGEMLIGLALIVGLFVGATAFLAGFMNWNFMMAGSASVNPVFFGISVFLVIAWKISGYLGLDYFLLPRAVKLWSPARIKAK